MARPDGELRQQEGLKQPFARCSHLVLSPCRACSSAEQHSAAVGCAEESLLEEGMLFHAGTSAQRHSAAAFLTVFNINGAIWVTVVLEEQRAVNAALNKSSFLETRRGQRYVQCHTQQPRGHRGSAELTSLPAWAKCGGQNTSGAAVVPLPKGLPHITPPDPPYPKGQPPE